MDDVLGNRCHDSFMVFQERQNCVKNGASDDAEYYTTPDGQVLQVRVVLNNASLRFLISALSTAERYRAHLWGDGVMS